MNVKLDTCALLALGAGSLPKRAAKCLGNADESYIPTTPGVKVIG